MTWLPRWYHVENNVTRIPHSHNVVSTWCVCWDATKSLCGECVWVSKCAAQLKTILVAKWEVPVSKWERLPKRVATALLFDIQYINNMIHRYIHCLTTIFHLLACNY